MRFLALLASWLKETCGEVRSGTGGSGLRHVVIVASSSSLWALWSWGSWNCIFSRLWTVVYLGVAGVVSVAVLLPVVSDIGDLWVLPLQS